MNETSFAVADPPQRERPGRGRIVLTMLALGLIGLWLGVWVESMRRDRLDVGLALWANPMSFLAGDFKVHIDHVARLQAAGIDPYHKADDWVCANYPYPPMVGRYFAWVEYFDTRTAASLWQGALALILAAGGLGAWRARRDLKIGSIPPALMVAAVLFSAPALFAVERGQADPLVVLPILVSAWLLGRRATWADLACGALLGAGAWLKYYPGLCAVGLVSLGRKRALAAFVVVAGLILVIDHDGFRVALKQAALIQEAMNGPRPALFPWNHSLVTNWAQVGFVHRSRVLRHVPGTVAAAVLLLPAVFLVSRKVARSRERSALALPYLLWLTAAATFATPSSNDYNLTALPIALISVWNRRDGVLVKLTFVLSMLWLQPFRLPIGVALLLFAKLATLYAVGASLASCASRLDRMTAEGIEAPPGSLLAFGRHQEQDVSPCVKAA